MARFTEVKLDKPSPLLGPIVEIPLAVVSDQIRADGSDGKIVIASGVHPLLGARLGFYIRDRETADRTIDILVALRDSLWPEG